MADGAGGEVHARDLAHIGMVPKRAAEPRVVVEPRFREEAEVRVDGKEPDCRVAFSDRESIARGPTRLSGLQPHDIVIERSENLGSGEDRGIVAGLGDLDKAYGLEPDEAGALAQKGDGFRRGSETILRVRTVVHLG